MMLDRIGGWLFDPAGLTPHGFCLLWEPGLIWTYALSDLAIGLAYFSIPLVLAIFARRRSDLGFRPLFWLFASFIFLCGTTHLLDVLTLWVPAYGLEGIIKITTAVVSIVTAAACWRLLPDALAVPSPAQLREVNAALRESKARFRASFEQSPVPMHTLDKNGIITGVSRSWLALLGYQEQDVVGSHLTQFQPNGPDTWVDADRDRLMADGEIRDLERRFLRRDGSAIHTLISARVERTANNEIIVCVLIDITGRHQAEEALRASEERLHQAQKMEAVGQLTGGIAHDFNNLLQGVSGCMDMTKRRIAQRRFDDVGRYIESAETALGSAAGLIQRMLAFARRQALQPTAVELDSLLRNMESLIQRGLGPEVQLELCLKDGTAIALCDANQLESALLNLTLNARDAMPDGGRLTITTHDRMLTLADVSDQDEVKPGGYVEIAIADTGTGMPADVLAHAFEPFFTTKSIGRGSGLGLSQVYGFVKQSGGFVRLESRLGSGTVVRLFLPFYSVPQATEKAPLRGVKSAPAMDSVLDAAPSKTVVVIEDEERVRVMIAEMLRDIGYDVLEAEDGPTGLRLAQSLEKMDLLVTDIGLPGLNGRKLAQAVRQDKPDLPILLITGYAGTALDEMDLAPGMEIMRKPFQFDALLARVRTMVEANSDKSYLVSD